MRKDPRYIEALRLFDMAGINPDEHWAIPSDPHAMANLRAATAYLASSDDPDAEVFLELVLRQYVGEKYRAQVETDLRRIAKAAQAVLV
jgi:hypothetical protein